MLSEDEPQSAKIILGVIFMAVILVIMCCVFGYVLYDKLRGPDPTALQELPVVSIPTLSAAAPAAIYSMQLPIILGGFGSVSGSEQIWKVTKIRTQGYELNGQFYDLATFLRIDGLDTAKGYCLNPGWIIPEIGTEYMLTAEGIFIPLHEAVAQSLQRFSKIR